MTQADRIEQQTGNLYGKLWHAYDDQLFLQSVELFERRLDLAGFDKKRITGKKCLDAGCGGGRNSIALAKIGADSVVGIDNGAVGLADARARTQALGISNVTYVQSSILQTPFDPEQFDFIWCAGVLMHTVDPHMALVELHRVLRPGGYLFLLVYATGGLRWPMVQLLRPIAAVIGEESISKALDGAGLPANKRRTYLDDLFVPMIDFFTWQRLKALLKTTGFNSPERWPDRARLDHEASLSDYRADLAAYLQLFMAGESSSGNLLERQLFHHCRQIVEKVADIVDTTISSIGSGHMSESDAMSTVIGQGHHRVVVRK
jgi:ubiquinone/menaquinone biosynthesis C-methylase UbiE